MAILRKRTRESRLWATFPELCNPGAYVILLGDTAPLSPVLFDWGVDAISDTKVVNPKLALKCISQGANFRQIRGVKRLTMKKAANGKPK